MGNSRSDETEPKIDLAFSLIETNMLPIDHWSAICEQWTQILN